MMKAYWIIAEVNRSGIAKEYFIDASTLKFAKNKIARKHKTNPRNVKVLQSKVIGYY